VDQISGTTPTDAPAQVPADTDAADGERPGFGSRGRTRRRARFLRKARELAYRDLGGLVYNLHRFGQRNDELVLAKLSTLGQIDAQLRALEHALAEREPVTVLREAGITACPRCAAIHSSEDRFCPNCGLSMARRVDLPIAGPPAAGAAPAPTPAPTPASAPATAPAPSAASAVPASAPVAAPPRAAPVPAQPQQETAVQEAVASAPAEGATPAAASTSEPSSAGEEEPTEILRPGAPGP
jgi:hypothetical protein